MGAYRAANGVDVGERHARVTKPDRLLDQLLRVTRTRKEGVIALDKQLAPADLARPSAARSLRHRRARRIMLNHAALQTRGMRHMFRWRFVWHRWIWMCDC